MEKGKNPRRSDIDMLASPRFQGARREVKTLTASAADAVAAIGAEAGAPA
jgi:hypothetical protein